MRAGAAGGWQPPIHPRNVSLPTCGAGHSVQIDDKALAEVSRYFSRLAAAEGLPAGRPQGFDASYLRHQLPGGMVGTMRRHLADSRVAHSKQP